MEPTKHQYDFDVGDRLRLPRPPRARGRVRAQHRGEPRDAGRAQLPPRGRVRHRERHPRQHRRQPRRPAERLGHRPVPELGRGPRARRCTRSCGAAGSRPAASTSTRSCAARASTGPTCSTPTSAASTRSPRRCSSRRTWSSAATLAALRRQRYAGWDGALGAAILDGRETLETLEARVAAGGIDPRPVSGQPGAAREPRQPARSGRSTGTASRPAPR